MDDCISRQAAIDVLDAYQVMIENGEENPYAWAGLRMRELPSAQAEIVRCKECAHNCGELDGYICCDTTEEISIWHSEDWFCADGERKDDA